MLDEKEIGRRLPLWHALAELLLDTDTPLAWGRRIAGSMRRANYSLEETYRIFMEEVGPAFFFNTTLVAGEWAAWDEDFVRKQVLKRLNGKCFGSDLADRFRRPTLEACWQHTLPHLLAALDQLQT